MINELQIGYDELADQYERRIWFDQHIHGVARLRKKLLSKETGKILDVTCGMGLNLAMSASKIGIRAVDLSPKMLEIAGRNASKYGLNVNLAVLR